jgi:hypothetical protein
MKIARAVVGIVTGLCLMAILWIILKRAHLIP